jgi:hypothetical protein
MRRAEWNKTPYAGSTAKDTDADIKRLLAKYGVTATQVTEHAGPNGRPAYTLRFAHKDRTYRIPIETLHAEARPDELMTQAKRAVYHFLKTCLEATTLFFPAEQALFAFLEINTADGRAATVYDVASQNLAHLTGGDLFRVMLPAHREDSHG